MSRTRTPAQLAYEAEQCMRLHAQGHTYREIADMLTANGITIHYSTVARRIDAFLESTVLPGIDEAKKIELARLDELINAFGPKAQGGDTKAADIVLKAVSQRSRILNLEAKQPDTKPTASGPQPAIVGMMQRQKLKAVGNP